MIRALNEDLGTKLGILLFWIVTLSTAVGACVLFFSGQRFEGWVGIASLFVFIIVQVILPRAAGMSNPTSMRIMISLLMLISLTIGRYFSLYKRIVHFDKLQHFLYGIMISLIAVVILYRLIPIHSRRQSEFHPAAIGIFTTGTTMIILFIWELFEYTCDRLFNSDMQDWKAGGISGLTDTMLDLAVGFLGALLASAIIMIVYSRNREIFYNRFLAGFFPLDSKKDCIIRDNREEAI
ncbi:MAG: hypothetical protein GX028_04915 [Clostridiaceae bacterium]|nr:hypothetical protein [Clostridiaceae bacterium]